MKRSDELLRNGQYKMNIVIPLAGKDPRFKNTYKPLQNIGGKPLIVRVAGRYPISASDRIIFIILQEDETRFNVSYQLEKAFGGRLVFRYLNGVTHGSPCTILDAAKDIINTADDLLIELGDVVRDETGLVEAIRKNSKNVSGIIPVEKRSIEGKLWGYVEAESTGRVLGLYEKERGYRAPWATMGLYYFSRGKDFVWAAEQMIRNKSFLYNDNFFVGPVYNELIRRGDTTIISENIIEAVLGSPEEIGRYQKTF